MAGGRRRYPSVRQRVWDRDRELCRYCGVKTRRGSGGKQQAATRTIDHIKPRARGGTTTLSNCVTACARCNNMKGDKTISGAQMVLLPVGTHREQELTRELQEEPAESGNPDSPMRPWAGPATPKLVVVGEHVPASEQVIFRGPAGVLFKESLAAAGIPIHKLGFCEPGRGLPRLLEQVGVEWVLLSGDKALRMYRPDLHTQHMHGRVFEPESGPRCFSTLHHVAVHRAEDMSYQMMLITELKELRRVAQQPEAWRDSAPTTCVWCRKPMRRRDAMGVAMCDEHYKWRTRD